MDPVHFEKFIADLESAGAKKMRAADLTPGCVIATGAYKKHVVVESPKRLNSHTTTLAIALRHVHGGHTVRPYFPGGGATVSVHHTRLPQKMVDEVLDVPPCVIPDAPAVGDRVVMQWRNDEFLGRAHTHQYDGERWCSVAVAEDGHLANQRYSSHAVRAFVRLTDTPIEYGWYVYLPAADPDPHLYLDGRAVPARTADELEAHDVVLLPGGGRLEVEEATVRADSHTLRLHVLAPSRHRLRYLTWASKAGDRIEHHGRHGMLYPTEPRASEARTPVPLAGKAA
jgi:hypothetical protein